MDIEYLLFLQNFRNSINDALTPFMEAISYFAVSVCAYRPWIRDVRVLPAGDAIKTATGYSFPSGHTTTATPIYGGLALS